MKERKDSADNLDRNIKLTFEYDGTKFHGWQWQPNVRTVQGVLQRSLKQILQEKVTLIGAGRTDAGVHALGQVANFHTKKSLSAQNILNGVNAVAERDVRILSAEEVENSFHARYDAKQRTYRYVIAKRPIAIGRQYAWHCEYLLDTDAMRAASTHLTGEHDFKSFSQTGTEEKHHISTVHSIDWFEDDKQIAMEIVAKRFLHNMIRIIIGTMVEVGRKKITPDDVKEILQARNRKAAGMTVPAQGLFLVRVEY